MSIFTNLTVILASAFVAFVTQMFFEMIIISNVPKLEDDNTQTETAVTRNLNILQSHPRCGITSGGREECWWNCSQLNIVGGNNVYVVIFVISKFYLTFI